MSEAKDKLVGYSYGITYDLGNSRTIQVNGTLLIEDDGPAMNQKIDTIVTVLERQRARAEVPTLEAELAQRHKSRLRILEQIQRLDVKIDADSRRKLPVKSEAAQVENLRVNLVQVEIDIEDAITAIAAVKKKAA